ncbi:unnamed protein product [Symbiodinium natans]|uniref:Uncharacterized protein n=1 Tax=Symbiodinium natans TaxID=878477 RepID=A0A812N3G8_9DINO|nr:unnamed protein product [Symbiodinium natans]
MASRAPHRPVSLAQSLHNDALDGAITFDEAISHTDGLKLVRLEKPLIVHKEPGCITVGDLPAKDEITDEIKKKVQFLDVLMNWEGELDFKKIEELFFQQRYSDLPHPIRMNGQNETPYDMQVFIVSKGENKWDIVKHIKFAEGSKVLHSTIRSMCTGRALEIDYCKQYREGGRALQYLLEAMGGFQVRYQKLIPAGSSTKPVKETEDIRKGFAFIREAGPEENSDGQFTSWTEEQVNDPNGPLFKWDKGTIKEFLRCLADKGSQANTIQDWPLTLKSFTPWALNTIFAPILPRILEHAVILIGKSEVGKSPTAYTLANLASAFWLLQKGREHEKPSFQSCNHLDYFRKERGRTTKPRVFDDGNFNLESPASVKAVTEVTGFDRKTMARWNASSYEKNQLFVVCSNPYDRSAEPALPPQTNSDTVSFEVFYKLVRPSFQKDFDEEDLMGVFKRSVMIVFTDIGIYVRSPGTHRDPIKRVAWPDKDFGVVSLTARPTLSAYLKGHLQQLPPNHAEDMQWSLNLLQAALDGEEVPLCYTVTGKEFSTGKKYLNEVRPDLAGISGSTTHYFEDIPESTQPPTKKLRSVKSSSSLLASSNAAPTTASAASFVAKDKVRVKQEPTDALQKSIAFKKKLGSRTLQINLSSSSEKEDTKQTSSPLHAEIKQSPPHPDSTADGFLPSPNTHAEAGTSAVDFTNDEMDVASNTSQEDPMKNLPDEHDLEAENLGRTFSQQLDDFVDNMPSE